jgi:hypothetical protein
MANTSLGIQDDSGKGKIDAEYMRECFNYDPESGYLFWKVRPLHHFSAARYMLSANTRRAGKRAFTTTDDKGYASARLPDLPSRAHRVIALAFLGWDEGWVDHINGDRSDNRLCNLRIVDAKQNAQNQRRAKNNTSGITGISYVPRLKRWNANIGGVRLGNYRCIGKAIADRRAAEVRLGYHENHGRAA